MSLAGMILILAGWMLTTKQGTNGLRARSLVAVLATMMITAGMFTVVQARF